MANPVLEKVKENPSSATTDIMGPSYSYANNIPGPSSLGVGGNGSFGQLFTNLGAIQKYVKVMINGDPPLGNAYYVNTGGSCTAPDGSSQSRMNYINNIPGDRGLLPASMGDLGGIASNMNGLIPGISGDIQGLNPVYLFTSLTEEANPSCDCYQCGVTSGNTYAFLTPSLSPDFSERSCKKVDMSKCVPKVEEFTIERNYMIPTIIAVLGIVFLTFSGK